MNTMKSRLYGLRHIMVIALLAIISHVYVLWRFLAPDDSKRQVFMTGANDGLEQMLPMQLYLYEKFKEGIWFYDTDFGLGGDFYTDLAYYYSTNIIYYINILFIRAGELLTGFDTSTVDFWAYNAFFISILKAFLIIYFTYRFLGTLGVGPLYGILGGFIFAASPTYFRFTVFWSFFSDVFIWLPLTLWALELLIRKKKPGLFIFATAATLINNFYFGYYQLIIAIVYLGIRLLFRKQGDLPRIGTIKLAVPSAIIGAGISTVAFFHAVRGFLNNDGREYDVDVPMFAELDWQDNIFYENYLIIILFIAIQALFTIKLYKRYFYKVFAVLTIVFMLFTLSPYIDMLFNGFQQPQKRWHYMLVFFHAVLIAQYFAHFREISLRQYLFSLIPVYIILAFSIYWKEDVVVWVYLVPVIHLVGFLLVYLKGRQPLLQGTNAVLLVLLTVMVSASHTNTQIYHDGITDRNHLFYISSNHYASDLQKHNVELVQDMKTPEQKLDYKVRNQDNTPMYMGFNGTSIYSSIIDGDIIDFYYNDLKVNIRYETISRYSTFQSRSNLFSLFNVDYMMREDDTYGIPLEFSPIIDDGTYTIYENEAPLPFMRYATDIYDPDTLTHPLEREHAMISGIVTDALEPTASAEPMENVLDEVSVEAQNATYSDGVLEVPEDGGGLSFNFDPLLDQYQNADVYIEMHVEMIEPNKRFTINVDGYPNERLFATSKYRTYADDLLYRVELEEEVPITFSSGKYAVELQSVHVEDYEVLEQESARPDPRYTVSEQGNAYQITLENPRAGIASVPIVYRDGMKVTGDDSGDLEAFRANYLMTGFTPGADDRVITISYSPPYYTLTLIISILSLLISFVYLDLFGIRRRLKRLFK
ncbi:YfhO family protein [Salinicoccus hispanicus]|uniref:YfhO family protein n=1 Tax=Salinicoccus hispanicus TaxID=157225 RepID=A0A6N8TYT8_9STAP|nr:YfhO family protein [Salinicoccus hispanicus]MXQ49866.1 YfhO family protein [Salinicoccus hispanicus]